MKDFIQGHGAMLGSVVGFGTALMSWVEKLTPLIGFVGAIFGLLAGIYAWKIRRLQFQREENAALKCNPAHPELCKMSKKKKKPSLFNDVSAGLDDAEETDGDK
jgi:hypothetical protein